MQLQLSIRLAEFGKYVSDDKKKTIEFGSRLSLESFKNE